MEQRSLPWKDRTVQFDSLRRYASQFKGFHSIVAWMYVIGVIPNDVLAMPVPIVKTEIDPEAINCGYLASSAFEWDRWGPSEPHQFLDAIECELAGSDQKNSIHALLLQLGRETASEPTMDIWID